MGQQMACWLFLMDRQDKVRPDSSSAFHLGGGGGVPACAPLEHKVKKHNQTTCACRALTLTTSSRPLPILVPVAHLCSLGKCKVFPPHCVWNTFDYMRVHMQRQGRFDYMRVHMQPRGMFNWVVASHQHLRLICIVPVGISLHWWIFKQNWISGEWSSVSRHSDFKSRIL